MSIQLPNLFEKKLEGHNREKGIVHSALASFGRWFETSGTPTFFRDYTDHGPKHISNVLATAAAMIRKEAVEVFSAADTTVFILATLLHDSALHIAEPGFRQLILSDAKDRRITGFDEAFWPSLWEEFLFAARRWDDRKLTDVFGHEFVQDGHAVSNPFDHWANLTLADYKLIGEFIRLNHPRLAHEFAIYGVPGIRADFLTLPEAVSDKWRDLSGVIARSHGLPIRTCLDYVAKHYHKREYQGIHAVYLMGLLRLADYLQIDSERAPEIVFRYRVVPSRISDLEWRAHHAIKNITPEHEDPESVEVLAEPPDVEAFLRVRGWLYGIQNELDTSWAVLGEVYGRYPNLKELGLHWRRVRSNLDDEVAFGETVSYLPRRVRMEVARAEMLSLLIRPLYGDDPSYGIRELMQNAVDAVRERHYFQNKYPGHSQIQLRALAADVVVWLTDFDKETNCAWLEVSDKGIGMTEKILTDYFLTAGASYRHSDQWQRVFERVDLPRDKTKPRAQILRAGRFGVGALAAFLLGEEMEVETRYINAPFGYRFKMFLAQEAVQLERLAELPVGTRVRIKVSRDAYTKLTTFHRSISKPPNWDWYLLNTPVVLRRKGQRKKSLPCSTRIDLTKWRTVETKLPMTIHWTFESAPRLSCNGIFVSDSEKLPEIPNNICNPKQHGSYRVRTPNLHVSDPDGHLPLGLTRKEIVANEYGFERDLYVSVMKDFFAKILAKFPEKLLADPILEILDRTPFQTERGGYARPSCLLSPFGFCLPFNDAFKPPSLKFKRLLWLKARDYWQASDLINSLSLVPDLSAWDCIILEQDLMLSKLEVDFGSTRQKTIFELVKSKDKSFQIQHFRFTDLRTETKSKNSKEVNSEEGGVPPTNEKWIEWKAKNQKDKSIGPRWSRWLVESKGMTASRYPFHSLSKTKEGTSFSIPFVAEFILSENWREPIDAGLLNEWWRHYFEEQWIPWEKKDRRIKFPKAYKELAPYLARYQEISKTV